MLRLFKILNQSFKFVSYQFCKFVFLTVHSFINLSNFIYLICWCATYLQVMFWNLPKIFICNFTVYNCTLLNESQKFIGKYFTQRQCYSNACVCIYFCHIENIFINILWKQFVLNHLIFNIKKFLFGIFRNRNVSRLIPLWIANFY